MKTSVHTLAKLSFLVGAAFAVAQAQATIVEPFTGGQLSAPGWSTGIGADASIYLSTPAPDGSYGIALSESTWSYNTTIQFSAGETLTAWINPGPGPATPGFDNAQGGRLFVGFNADATGADAFVAASDSSQLGFAHNPGYATGSFASSTAQVWGDQWYELSISRSTDGQSATATLFDTDGSTVLNTLTVNGLSNTATGIALYGVGGAAVASISVVPEPQSMALTLSGLVLMGAIARRRRA